MARTSRAMTVKELRVSAKGRWYQTWIASSVDGCFAPLAVDRARRCIFRNRT
jgi:hypothetical protein